MKKKVLAVLPGLIPSTIIGVIKPLLLLDRQGEIKFKFKLSKFCSEKDIKKNDLIIFCRNSTLEDIDVLYWAKKYDKKIIYDIDDNFFKISISSDLGRYHRFPINLFVLKQYLDISDMVRTYSNPMLNECKKINQNSIYVRSYFDFDLIKSEKKYKNSDKIKIVYATSRGNKDDLYELFINAVLRVLQNYENNIELYIWGYKDKRLDKFNNVFFMDFERDYNKFIKKFYRMNFDIGLAPLKDDVFHNSKTNNKFREYGACKIAGIYSKTEVYTYCVNNGVNGLLVNNNIDEWYSAIENLILDRNLREKIKINAYNDVLKEYSLESNVIQWKENIEKVFKISVEGGKCENNNIKDLKILCTYDNELNDFSKRYDALKILIGNSGIDSNTKKVSYISDYDNEKYDLCVYYTDLTIQSIEKIKALDRFGFHLIVDINECYLDEKEFIDFLNKNIHIKFVIPKQINLDIGNNFQNLIIIEDWVDTHRNKTFEDYFNTYFIEPIFKLSFNKSYKNIINEFENNRNELFYSLCSPIVKWGELLKEYKPRQERKKYSLFMNKVILKFNKIKLIINIIKRVYIKLHHGYIKLGKIIDYLILYIRINVFKKY